MMSKLPKPYLCLPGYCERGAIAAALLAFMLAGTASAVGQEWNNSQPIVLQAEGSFFVGGQDRLSDALISAAASAGTVTINQMYVQYQILCVAARRREDARDNDLWLLSERQVV